MLVCVQFLFLSFLVFDLMYLTHTLSLYCYEMLVSCEREGYLCYPLRCVDFDFD